LTKNALEIIPAPIYPDPNTQPIPEPKYDQTVYKPIERKIKSLIKSYKLLTPINPYKKDTK